MHVCLLFMSEPTTEGSAPIDDFILLVSKEMEPHLSHQTSHYVLMWLVCNYIATRINEFTKIALAFIPS